jgi:hypothetical protein
MPPAKLPGAGESALPEDTSPIEPENGGTLASGAPAADSDSGAGGSVLGSIVAGLLIGGLLFAIGFGPYRRWKATHGAGRTPTPPANPPQAR